MGLGIEVGLLADYIEHDEEATVWFREELAQLNVALAALGLAPHNEPADCDVFSTDGYGYSGLHHLRRCAAHLHYQNALPPPLTREDDPTRDELLGRYTEEGYRASEVSEPGLVDPSDRRFDHLILHSDAEGFYLPQAFERVIMAGGALHGWIGSSHALKVECERLAAALEMPADMLATADHPVLLEATGMRNRRFSLFGGRREEAAAAWRDHPMAALLCAKLHVCCVRSINTRAALVFV